MALTLIEAAKLDDGNIVRQAITEFYAGSSAILETMTFDSIPGGSLTHNQEGTLPGIGFRGFNEAYTPSTGVINPVTEVLSIAGGELDVDRAMIQTRGAGIRSTQERMKARALGLAWTQNFIKGDSESEPREFDGLQVRLVNDQLVAAGSTANGTALSLAVLDEAIDQTLEPTHLIMNKAMARLMNTASKTASIGGDIQRTMNQFGRRVLSYDGLPILTLDLDNNGDSIITGTEAASSGNATATSIYVVSFTENGVQGIQNGNMMVDDLGMLQAQPQMRTRIEWLSGIALFNGRAATRLWTILSTGTVTA